MVVKLFINKKKSNNFWNASIPMKKSVRLIILIFAFLMLKLHAQTKIDTAGIKIQLENIFARDQKTRTKGDSTANMKFIDSCNLFQVEKLIDLYGWPGKSFVGAKGNLTVFLVIQHSNLATQEKYLPLMQASVENGESSKASLALLIDRVLMGQGKKQIYGSQVIYNDKGEPVFYQIDDEKNVNVRRATMGLEPLEEYAQHFGIVYSLPTQ